MNTIEIVFSIYGMIAIALVLVALKKIDADNKRIKKRMLKEAKHGEWVKSNPLTDTFECSLCGMQIPVPEMCSPYCPYCGAEMRGEENE